jgi:hydroxypyruvate reductase
VLGSGLLHASSGRILVPASLPADLGRLLVRVQDRMQPPALPAVPYRIVASVREACRAAATQGRAEGLQVRVARARFAGPAGRLGMHCARAVLAGPSRTLHVWGGESTMTLPPAPGYGGRNQHLALAAATVLAGHAETALLAAGTDGIDGLTADAGAVVDGGTLERGIDGGLDPRQSLLGADSGRFLEASGDLLHTGATLTNVGDVVLGVRGRGQFE